MTLAVVLGSPTVVGTIVWIVALLGVLAAQRLEQLVEWAKRGWVAMASIALAALYVLLLMAGDSAAKQEVRQHLAEHNIAINGLMIGPTPVNPLRRDVIARSGDRYTFGVFDWLASPRFRITDDQTRLPGPEAETTAALGASCVRGMVRWMRFPIVEVDAREDGFDVHLIDARYARQKEQGFGTAVVRLDPQLTPECKVR